MTEIGSKRGGGVAGVEFMAGPPQPSPQPGREQNRVLSCLPPLAGGLRGVLGSHTQPRPPCRKFPQTAKKLVGCYADFDADEIRIQPGVLSDPDFICGEIRIATHEFLRSLRKFLAVWAGLCVRAKNPP